MRRIGIQGGSSLWKLGMASDVVLFFSILKARADFSEYEMFQIDRLYLK